MQQAKVTTDFEKREQTALQSRGISRKGANRSKSSRIFVKAEGREGQAVRERPEAREEQETREGVQYL